MLKWGFFTSDSELSVVCNRSKLATKCGQAVKINFLLSQEQGMSGAQTMPLDDCTTSWSLATVCNLHLTPSYSFPPQPAAAHRFTAFSMRIVNCDVDCIRFDWFNLPVRRLVVIKIHGERLFVQPAPRCSPLLSVTAVGYQNLVAWFLISVFRFQISDYR